METAYELFDHTADIGIRVFAPTMAGLVRPAGEGLYAVIGELLTCGEPRPASWDLSGDEPAILLRDYLAELLVLFERQKCVVTSPDVTEFSDGRLAVEGRLLPVDEPRSVYQREVKAITYHELAITEIPGGYQATIIVDI